MYMYLSPREPWDKFFPVPSQSKYSFIFSILFCNYTSIYFTVIPEKTLKEVIKAMITLNATAENKNSLIQKPRTS